MHGNSSSSSSSSSLSSCCNTTMNNNRSSSSSSSSSSWQQLLHHPDHRHGNPGGHIGIDMALQAPLKLSGEAGESHLWNQVLLFWQYVYWLKWEKERVQSAPDDEAIDNFNLRFF
ncbi:hypothetical protein ACMD2_16254 [Ananas comosus]|uniref:Uncharacterized protein n=1 Tax=Ananas comosus TaxID=4615 RepID=A0A199UKX8_ANACO|nr:hypothetical protein ACMD2_16254 [Ananas comosus]